MSKYILIVRMGYILKNYKCKCFNNSKVMDVLMNFNDMLCCYDNFYYFN